MQAKGHHQSANLLMAHYARRTASGLEEPGSSSTAEEFRAEMEAAFLEIAARSQPAATTESEPKGASNRKDDSGSPDEAPLDPRL